jgi:replicative DNA helicase
MAATPQDPTAAIFANANEPPISAGPTGDQDASPSALKEVPAFEGISDVHGEAPLPDHPGFDPVSTGTPWDGDRGFDDESYADTANLASDPTVSRWRGRTSAGAGGSGQAADPARSPLGPAVAAADLLTERALLASCLIDQEAMPLAMSQVKPEDFYDQRHTWIFEAMLVLNERRQPIEIASVYTDLTRQKRAVQVGMDYLLELTSAVGATLAVEHHAKRISRLSAVRRILRASQQIQGDFQLGDDPEEFIQRTQTNVNAALTDSVRTAAVGLDEIVRGVFDQIMASKMRGSELLGISTGYRDLDRMTQGMHPTNLIILAARPAMGKTALAMNIALDVALRARREPDSRGHMQHGVLVFSMEMGKDELVQRLLSSRARIELTALRKGTLTTEDEVSLRDAADELAQLRFLIDDTPGLTSHDLRARSKLAQMQGPLDLIVVDYLQLAKGTNPRQSREQEIGEISRSLKGMAKELNCTVLALAQLNRGVEQRPDKRPMMSDLRESGSIEQDADLIAFIYREVVYSKDPMQEHMAELIIAKQRAGSTGKVDLHFDGKYTRFTTMEQRIDDSTMGTRRE